MAPAAQGLDKDVAPSAAMAKRMLDAIGGRWWNVYIGGPKSAGFGWTPALLREYVAHGIDRFMLTYVGRQAGGPLTREQGQADARDAIAIAKRFGYTGNFPLCLDVEQHTFGSAPSKTIEYARAWCTTVLAHGVRPGIYANPGPLKAMHGAVPADFVWVASWVSHVAGPRDPRDAPQMPAELWPNPSQRAWQYAGAFDKKPCRVLGVDVDINVADLGLLAHPPGVQPKREAIPLAPARAAGPPPLRRGDKSELVETLTRRLSYVRSSRTGKPYLDGARGRLDTRAVAALRAFQTEHGLDVDGLYGPASAHALIRAVRLEQARRRRARLVGTPNGSPAAAAPPKLVVLVDELRRLEAETDRAWKRLAAYGRTRTDALGRAGTRDVGLADLSTILLRIEDKLTALVEVERREAAFAPASAVSTAPTGETTVTEEAVPAIPTHNGDGGSAPAPAVQRRMTLAELSDEQLLRQIDRLDQKLDRARSLLIARYAAAEKRIIPLSRADAEPVRGRVNGGSVAVQPTTQASRPAAGPPRRKAAIPATDPVRNLQRILNEFSGRFLKGMAPLVVDGKKGPATKQRIRLARYYLGYSGSAGTSAAVDEALLRRLKHPRSPKHSNPAMLARATRRRRAQHKNARRSMASHAGVATFDGRPVAAWLKPYLVWARQHGWEGTLNSGWRDPLYSEHLCRQKCGAPRCAGTCAGRSSNHVGRIKPAGAIDVTHYDAFAKLMRKCPLRPRIFNDLPRDRVHFSVTGH